MRSVGASLSTFLDTTTACPPIRHLITVTPKTGSIVRWTDHERDLQLVRPAYPGDPESAGTYTFLAGGEGTTNPLVDVGDLDYGHGTDRIDKLTLKLGCGTGALFNGVRLPLFASQKGFDDAGAKIERLYIPATGGITSQAMWWWGGPVGRVKPTSVTVELDVESGMAKLAATLLPRLVFGPGCVNMLYDSACQLVQADNTYACTVAASPTPTVSVFGTGTVLPAATQLSDYFRLGVVTFTSGTLSGQKRGVRIDSFSAGVHTLTMDKPLPVAPVAGDAFSLFPGCDKQQATCGSITNSTIGKFRISPSTYGSNVAHFRGFPYVPRAEVG